jgi:hypothetical protein
MKRRRVEKSVEDKCDSIRFKVCKCCDGKKLSLLLLPASQRGQVFVRHAVIVEFKDVRGRKNVPKPRGAEHSNVSKTQESFPDTASSFVTYLNRYEMF